MSEAVRRGLYIFIAALAVIVGGVVYEQFWLGGAENASPAVGGPFSLTDQNGAAHTFAYDSATTRWTEQSLPKIEMLLPY